MTFTGRPWTIFSFPRSKNYKLMFQCEIDGLICCGYPLFDCISQDVHNTCEDIRDFPDLEAEFILRVRAAMDRGAINSTSLGEIRRKVNGLMGVQASGRSTTARPQRNGRSQQGGGGNRRQQPAARVQQRMGGRPQQAGGQQRSRLQSPTRTPQQGRVSPGGAQQGNTSQQGQSQAERLRQQLLRSRNS